MVFMQLGVESLFVLCEPDLDSKGKSPLMRNGNFCNLVISSVLDPAAKKFSGLACFAREMCCLHLYGASVQIGLNFNKLTAPSVKFRQETKGQN